MDLRGLQAEPSETPRQDNAPGWGNLIACLDFPAV